MKIAFKNIGKILKLFLDGPNDIIAYSESKNNLKFTGNINGGGTKKKT